MSRRTSEASKAIRDAWEKESQLVLEGKGTRDWTPEQQQSIIDKGKAYDDDGKAFEGHHMKSAEAYPEYQGDADNIQFLTKSEHQDAHGGSYRNSTNGYYDPITNVTRDFGENKYEACEVIKLSDPVANERKIVQEADASTEVASNKNEKSIETEVESTERAEAIQPKNKSEIKHIEVSKPANVKPSSKAGSSFGDKILCAIDAVKGFSAKHPVLTGILKWLSAAAAVAVAGEALSNKGSSNKGNSNRSGSHYTPFYDPDDDYSNSLDSDYSTESSTERDYPDERSSPREHDVSGYDRQYNGKTVHVNSYKRGGKNKDE